MWPKASVENGKPFWVKLPIIAIVPLANMVSLTIQSPGDPIDCKVDVIFLAEPENSYSKGLQVCFSAAMIHHSNRVCTIRKNADPVAAEEGRKRLHRI